MIQEAHYRKTNTERVKGACLLSRSASFVVIQEEEEEEKEEEEDGEDGEGGEGGRRKEGGGGGGLSRILGCV